MSGTINGADCALVDTWLDDWLAGRLADAVARRFDEHVAGCERCRRLAAIVAEREAGAASDAPADDVLVSAVLSQTTGSPCARAETLLPALVDEELDADSRAVLQAHLAHCAGCSRLLAAVQEAEQVLPALAEMEPPLGFTQRVLSATTAAPAPSWYVRFLARPRASLELAYVGAVLLVVLLGNPVVAFHQAEQRASELAGAVPVARLGEQLGVKDAAVGAIGRMLAGVASMVNAVQAEVATRLTQARLVIDAIETAVGNTIAWIANIDVKQLLGGGHPSQPRGQPAGSPARQPRWGAPAEPGSRR